MFKLRASGLGKALFVVAAIGAAGMWVSTAAQAGPAVVDAPQTTEPCVDNTGAAVQSFACGSNAVATGNHDTAVGDHALADGGTEDVIPSPNGTGRASAYGSQAQARGFKSTATGAFAYAGWDGDNDPTDTGGRYADYTTATGASAAASADYATATGAESKASGSRSTAVGALSVASNNNSAAFGYNVHTDFDNQMKFGNSNNTYTMTGINSSDSKARQSGPTYFTTSDANGNLATSDFSVSGLTDQVNQNTDGVAIALASAGPQILPQGKHFAMSGGYGNFNGSGAFGINGVAALNDTGGMFVSGGLGVGVNTGVVGGSVHATVAW